MRYVLAAALVIATSSAAFAEDKADCEYLEITASTTKAPSIDPELKALDKKLKKPPFASWKTFHKRSVGPI